MSSGVQTREIRELNNHLPFSVEVSDFFKTTTTSSSSTSCTSSLSTTSTSNEFSFYSSANNVVNNNNNNSNEFEEDDNSTTLIDVNNGIILNSNNKHLINHHQHDHIGDDQVENGTNKLINNPSTDFISSNAAANGSGVSSSSCNNSNNITPCSTSTLLTSLTAGAVLPYPPIPDSPNLDQPKKRYKQNESNSPILLSALLNNLNNLDYHPQHSHHHNGQNGINPINLASPLKLLSNHPPSSPFSSQSIFLSYLDADTNIPLHLKPKIDQNELEVYCGDITTKDEIILPFLENEDEHHHHPNHDIILSNSGVTTTSSSSPPVPPQSSPLIDIRCSLNKSLGISISCTTTTTTTSSITNHNNNNTQTITTTDIDNNNNIDERILKLSVDFNNNCNQNNNHVNIVDNNHQNLIYSQSQHTNVMTTTSSSCVPFLHNISQPDQDVRTSIERNVPEDDADEEEEEEEEVFNPWVFMKHLGSIPHTPPQLTCSLPPKSHDTPKISLVLDLDETLVHCSTDPIDKPDLTFSVTFNAIEYKVFAKKRPFFEQFLVKASEMFEVIIFTASQAVYANKLLDMIDPNNHIKHRLFRDSCVYVEGNYLKDLSILGRDLSHVVIVDNSPQSFGFQVNNGIPIESWFEDENDKELISLITFLESLTKVDDVRPLIRDRFGVQKLIDEAY